MCILNYFLTLIPLHWDMNQFKNQFFMLSDFIVVHCVVMSDCM